MRVKDWISGLYEFGYHSDGGGRDLSHPDMEDILVGVSAEEAKHIKQLVDNYVDALWWMYDRLSPEHQAEFRDLIDEGPVTGRFRRAR